MLKDAAILIACIFSSMVCHEYAHGWVAWKLGDPTAKAAGRLTLNPLKHIDLFGTVILPLLLLTLRFLGLDIFVFGWAKPVPVNFLRLNNPKRDMMWVGLAGPAVNIVLGTALIPLIYLEFLPWAIREIVAVFIVINFIFAVFNLIPIPPLDGSRFVMGLLPRKLAVSYAKLERYGMLIIVVLLYFGLLGKIVLPVIGFIGNLLGVKII